MNPNSDISKSLKILKIHEKLYIGGVNGGILQDHIISLKHGLGFLETFLEVSQNVALRVRLINLVSYVETRLYPLTYHGKDENIVRDLEPVYVDLREKMMNIIMIKEGTYECDVIFPEISTNGYDFSTASFCLREKIKEIVTLDCKADLITPIMKDLDYIMKMLKSLLEPFFIYAKTSGWSFNQKEEQKDVLTRVTNVLDRAACFIYLAFVWIMDDEMIQSWKSILNGLIIEETLIMEMYLALDIPRLGTLESHIFMSLRLLEWNKKCYFDTDTGSTLEDHFMSIKQGLKILVKILKISIDENLKLCIQDLVAFLKLKLYSLGQNQVDENLIVNLEHAYGKLREEMMNVFFNPGTNGYDMLFPDVLDEGCCFSKINDFLLKKLRKLVNSSCKADQATPTMEEFRKKLKSLKPFFDYLTMVPDLLALKKEEKEILAALTNFLCRATCLIYLSFVANLNEDVLVSLKNKFSLLIEEIEIKDFESDIDISLSLLKMPEEYHICNEAILNDHIISLKHGIEFLRWLPKIYIDTDFEQHIILLAGNVKQKLESLTYKPGDESLNMDVNAYADLREELKKAFISIERTIKYDDTSSFRAVNDFLIEKITTLITSNCKADQVAHLKKELEDLLKMLTSLKPLGLYVDNKMNWLGDGPDILPTLLTVHHKLTFPIYLSFVGNMDPEMALSVKSDISTTIKETDVFEMYNKILNLLLFKSDYLEQEFFLKSNLYLLENLILLLKSNVESFNGATSKLYEVLIDIYGFMLGVYPNVLLRKLYLLHRSFQEILVHSIPIVCSCYFEYTEVDFSSELNCVLDLIKHIKTETHEIKLYYFPGVDDLGFLEFFSGYLEDLKNQEVLIKEEIYSLHIEVHSLLSLAKIINQEQLNETPWTDMINMAYQAEYMVDLCLVSNSRDMGLISSLSKIIEQLKSISSDVHDQCSKRLPVQDVAVTFKPQVLGTPTQSDNDAIVSLQEEADIIEYLLKGENKLDVISIVGMAGVGKTTLALALYKNPLIAANFDILVWCTVSQTYQNRDLLVAILDQVEAFLKNHRSRSDGQESAHQNPTQLADDEDLASQLCKCLKNGRYLIVLDDIWDNKLWIDFKRYFPDRKNRSRVLITTRNKTIAVEIESKVNELHGLSDEKSWELFMKKMFQNEGLSDNLLKISKGIVEHCKGLPLSIVIVAGILSDKERTEKNWNEIAESVSSIILSDPEGKCKGILELSYNHLPNNLRSCFLYLGSFTEDEEIPLNRLTFLWIAEGLVSDTKSNSAEEVAKKYMEDLIAKSLLIPTKERSRGGVKSFRLHDLLRDFCLVKAKEKHFFTVLDKRNYSPALQDPRRLIINGANIKDLKFSCHSIRSMICYDLLGGYAIEDGIKSSDMVLLRLLDVGDVSSSSFPNVSSLVHLRYLALGLRNYYLPVSASPIISKLQNLQILILRCGFIVIKVPDLIWDMVKLRHVHISMEASFQVDSNRLENSSFLLENLRSLSNARVSCGDSKWLRKLSGLQRLHCTFIDDDIDLEEEDIHIDPTIKGDSEEYDGLENYQNYLEDEDDLEGDDRLEENEYLEEEEEEEEEEDIYQEEDVDLSEEDDREEEEEEDDIYQEEDVDLNEEDDREEDGDLEEDDDDLEDNQSRKLTFNDHLTSLKVRNRTSSKRYISPSKFPRFTSTCQLPISLRELTLSGFLLKSNDISVIGNAVPGLEVFKINSCSVLSGYEWNVDDDEFPELKVLKLSHLKICKWNTFEYPFPKLEQLWMEECDYLDEIPLAFGSLSMLRLISLKECASSVDDSARKIEELQHDEQNTEMRVSIYPKSKHGIYYFNRPAMDTLVQKLTDKNPEQQRAAAEKLSSLAELQDNIVCMVDAGAIPLLVKLLSSPDSITQEHVITALLKLSINVSNKKTIANAGAIPDIVELLKNGSTEARDNAAETLFSLAVLDENMAAIGAAGGMPPLLDFLIELDAPTPFDPQIIYLVNKVRVVRTGIVPPLIRLLKDHRGEMMDAALAILAILARHSKEKRAIGRAEPIPLLIDLMRTASPGNRENAASVMWSLCSWDSRSLNILREHGAEEVLKQLCDNATDKAKRKAFSLIKLLQRIEGDNLLNHALTI